MTDLIPAELLEKGAAYIEEHGLWQWAFYPQDVAALVTEWETAQREGSPACAMGALVIASQGGSDYIGAGLRLAMHLGQPVPSFNDTPGRTAAEVADAMRACATNLRGAS